MSLSGTGMQNFGSYVLGAQGSRKHEGKWPAKPDSRYQAWHNTWCVQVLRSPKEAFAAAMQSWHERCEKCVCLQGDYVEK